MKRDKTIIQSFISATFAFLLTLLFVALFICAGFIVGVFNDRSIIRKINESNYYNKVYETLTEKAEELVQEVGLPPSVLVEVITLDRVYISGKNYIEQTLAGKKAEGKTDKIREILTQNIQQYFDNEDIIQTTELNTDIEVIISRVEQEYKQGIEFQFINYITTYQSEFQDLMKIIVPILLVLISILCYFLIRMQKYIHRGIRYIAYAMIASSGITIITSAFLLLTKQYEKVEASPKYYYDFVVSYLNWDMKIFLYLGFLGVILSVLLVSLVGFLKNRVGNN